MQDKMAFQITAWTRVDCKSVHLAAFPTEVLGDQGQSRAPLALLTSKAVRNEQH